MQGGGILDLAGLGPEQHATTCVLNCVIQTGGRNSHVDFLTLLAYKKDVGIPREELALEFFG